MKVLSPEKAKAVKIAHSGSRGSPSELSLAVAKLKIGGAILMNTPKDVHLSVYINRIRVKLLSRATWTWKQGIKVRVNRTEDGNVLITRIK